MSGLDERERRYTYLAAGLAATTAVALWAPAFGEPAALALTGIGVAMAGLLALAARRGSRLLTGAAAVLLAFGPWGMAWLVGLPYLALAAWLAVRAPRPGRRPRPVEREEGDGKRPARRARPAAEGREGRPVVPRRPPAPNKRYTPPRHRS